MVLSPKTPLILFLSMVLMSFLFNNHALCSPNRKDGNVSVELRDVSKSLGDVTFDHPYFIAEDRLRLILSSLRFFEKGMLKKGATKRIFLDKEVNMLAPLIIESLSKAGPKKEVFVSVTSEKGLFRDKTTTFSLFILGKEMNIAFSQVRATKEEPPSFKEWKVQPPQEPTSLTAHGSWELVPGMGHHLKEGHKNWLIISVEDKAFEPPVAVVKEEGLTTNSLIEERLRRLEERMGVSPTGKGGQEVTTAVQPAPTVLPKKEASLEKNLGQRLRELKTLLNEELISLRDYEKKKLELLQEEPPPDRSVPDMLKELRALKDEGLITERDYEHWKAKLLEKL